MKTNFSLLFLLLSTLLFSQNNSASFYNLSMNDGLSSNEITAILKDAKGYLWFGSRDGLNRYDGSRFRVYRNELGNPQSIGGDIISSIVEDHQGKLWIATDAGLSRFERETDTFMHYNDILRSKTRASNKIFCLFVDSKGFLWVGTENGLKLLNPRTGQKVALAINKEIEKQVGGKAIVRIYEDSSKNLWILTWGGGVIQIDAQRKSVKLYCYTAANPSSLPDNTVISICEDNNKQLWMGTSDVGLCKFDPRSEKFTRIKHPLLETYVSSIVAVGKHQLWVCQGHSLAVVNTQNSDLVQLYTNDVNDPKSFTPSTAINLYKDNTGIIWISTGAGITYSDPNRDKFSVYYHKIGNAGDVEKYYSTAFCFDSQNNAWVGTFEKGLFYFDKAKNKFTHYPASQIGASSNTIRSLCQLKSGLLWIGTSDGINIFDPKRKKTVGQLKHSATNSNSLFHNSINNIVEDSRKNIWVGTQESLDLILKRKVIHFTKERLNGLSNYKVTDILEDKKGAVWIGTIYGLNKYDWKKNSITQYQNVPGQPNCLSSSVIISLFEDSKGTLWVATRKGLNVLNRATNTFHPYLLKEGLENPVVYKIAEDQNRNLWLVTASGLLQLNPTTGAVKKYDESDGLNIGQAGIFKDKQGDFYVGGTHTGFYNFDPSLIKLNPILPPIYISSLSIFNKVVAAEPNNRQAILQKSISETKEITLQHNQSMVEFELAALNYTLSDKNKFAYRLEGYDEDWVYLKEGKRSIIYTNLDPGRYTLKVKGSNNDGVWNEEGVSLGIKIQPPFWQSGLAYLFYFALVIGLLLVYRQFSTAKIQRESQARLDRMQSEKNLEMNQLKLRFFTNISHEFRTPLTLISGPLNKLAAEVRDGAMVKERLLEQFGLMQRNADRLMMLINQLLDLQKSETGTLKLNLVHGDLLGFIQSLFKSFVPLAEQRNIEYTFSSSVQSLETDFDTDKLEKIASNLLSNAFKFTKDKVKMSLKVDDSYLIIEVEDNGIGISKNNLSKIFDNFYQVDNSNTRKSEGSGIGLALTRELVLLHNGKITIESEENLRTVFRVILPINSVSSQQSTVNGQQLSVNGQQSTVNGHHSTLDGSSLRTDNCSLLTDKPLILIVEDNADLRLYIRDVLSDAYHILEAENGKLGVETALETMPDLIVSDVMMPIMDGMELCNTLKQDDRTSHIPIVLLTALSAAESQLKGLETGADDYVTKPFNAELLLARVKNLIETRRRLQVKFQQAIHINTQEIASNPADEKILKKAIDLVEQNLEDSDFDIQQFIDGMNMSRAGLYTKIKAITGQSVSDFIKSIRLKRAAQLLLTNEFTVSEICDKVGFQSRSYFNQTFKEQFSMSPSQFVKSREKIS